ncbi:hypothetical protein FWF93_02965 [Candidatus Saccharibacteria bacterium]|nr:hypothetical protein [Candidatus Saccharibacteria bacterium]
MEKDREHGGAPKIQESDFYDVYSQEELEDNVAELEKAKSRFAGDKLRADDAADVEWAIAHGMAGYSDWFQDFEEVVEEGEVRLPCTDVERATPIITLTASEYDDVLARTDVILVLNNIYVEGAVLSLDATCSRDGEVISKKFAKSIRKNGRLPHGFEELTYVDATVEAGIKGSVPAAPHFVVGMNADEMSDFRDMGFRPSGENDAAKNKLERKVALKLVNEMQAQAKLTESMAKQNGDQEYLEIISPVAKYLTVARQKAERAYEAAGGRLGDLQLDDTYRLIMKQVEHMGRAGQAESRTLRAPSKISPKIYLEALPEEQREAS